MRFIWAPLLVPGPAGRRDGVVADALAPALKRSGPAVAGGNFHPRVVIIVEQAFDQLYFQGFAL